MNDLELRIETEFPPELLRAAARLYRLAGWVEEHDNCGFLAAALANSCAVCVAYRGGRPVGMGRALGDKVSDAYIQDVVVDPEHRRRGIGGAIVHTLVAELRKRGIDWIALVGEPGTEEFYRGLGFDAPRGFTFWRARGGAVADDPEKTGSGS